MSIGDLIFKKNGPKSGWRTQTQKWRSYPRNNPYPQNLKDEGSPEVDQVSQVDSVADDFVKAQAMSYTADRIQH